LSKLIRYNAEGPTVFIGEQQRDALVEAKSEERLRQLFPQVSLITTPDGTRLIPISETQKLEDRLFSECEKARKQGFDQGHRAGLDKGLDEARNVLKQFERAIEDAVSQRIALLEEAKQKVLELVVKISRKVTFAGLQIDQEATLVMIEGVINQLVDRSQLRIKVHPNHLPLMEQNMNRFLSSSTSIKNLTFEADPRVRIGGCFIETPTGDIDARLTSQFDVIDGVLHAGAGDA
jgi:flagellar biosynthesis/type III secretory pathway protein FliH